MSGAHVFIDHSQFPGQVRRDLLDSLRARSINPKFHYDTYKQAAKWLTLHEAYSPARRDDSCTRIYDAAFRAAMEMLAGNDVHVIGLGCGGGQKEARLLELLRDRLNEILYAPCDVSLPLVLTAREAALPFLSEVNCRPIVCDLGTSETLPDVLDASRTTAARIITLFGIVPNFEPERLLSQITRLLRADDWLLISANLAPGRDYAAGVRAVLPQYDNALTRDWLMTLPIDLGFEFDDGEMTFAIETDAHQLRRIEARFDLKRPREIRLFGEGLSFSAGERIRLFFSYRHTTGTLRALMRQHDFDMKGEWLNDSAEEGVFLCRKTRS
jgi:L-histidine Nalpha-methyltransferase